MRKATKFMVWAVIGRPMGDAVYPEEVWHLAPSEADASGWAEIHLLNGGVLVRVVRLAETTPRKGKVKP